MDKNELISLFHKELRQEALTQGFIREESEHVVRHISQFGETGFILSSNVNERNVRGIIKKELNYFSNLGQVFEWKVYSYDKPDSLKDILEQEGFTIDEAEALMVMKLDDQHPLLNNDQHFDLKEITNEQGIQDIIDLEDAIWNVPHAELGERLWRDKQNNPESLYLYGIYEDGQLVSAAWMYIETNSSFASLWGGSTLPMYRGKRYYTTLLAARAKKAYEKGHPFLTVDASPMSRPILEKCGFLCLAYSYGCQSPSPK
ncbi:GNAT family N-acetyltransferase [Viridibacillus sp. YIM B01967]|uniref:GNAT family N-acetyltransferase n=1 Tax=Viridibacillus soli TaxID=2798301 RepID=A0ABS1HB69_9BACL|nr:GNAT family N-acetyltransferase [Viridibacillus soli]MBK3496332.1 GNAT family N-acetyltransferase [Viridibacillus soli]